MGQYNRHLGLQLTLCLAFCLFSDGFIHGFQMNRVKIQLTDTIPSSLVRRNILHSETTSNRQSSSLLAKLPAEPAFQELNNADKFKSPQRKKGETGKLAGSVAEGVEEKFKNSNTERAFKNGDNMRKSIGDPQTYMIKLRQALESNKLRTFVKVLKSLAMENFGVFSLTELTDMFELVKLSELDSSMTADVIWSLGKLNFMVTNSEHKTILMSLMNRFCEQSVMTPREVTTSLVGFSKLRFRWTFMTDDNRSDIIDAVAKVASTLNDREVGNLLHSLSKMGAPWSIFPKPMQNNLLESFIRVSKLLVSQQGSMAIYSLGLLGVNLDNVTPAVRDHIFVVALSVLEESKVHVHPSVTQQVSNVIYGLAKMGVKYKSLPIYVVSGIEDGILNTMDSMNEQEVSNTIYSLGLMGAKWTEFPQTVTDNIKSNVVFRFNRMITQGVSNIIYGMGLMGAQWNQMGDAYTDAAYAAVVAGFGVAVQRRGGGGGGGSAQAVANVIYSLGISGASWEEFPPRVRTALTDALVEFGPELTSQEMSNLCYGLGLMRADYHKMPPDAIRALEINYDRMKSIMNEQEVCSTMHGFAKMSTRWDDLSDVMRRSMLVSIASLASVGALCLACTIYSLGMLGATWDRLPYKIRECFMNAANQRNMQDQTISNVVYGLSLLKASWATLEPEFRDVLLLNLAQEDAFMGDVSQHISNTIWGMAKMDSSWEHIPGQNLEKALNRASKMLTPQETANVFYGLAVLDASWSSLSVETQSSLCDALLRTVSHMTSQETANVMYSLALMTYDAPYADYQRGSNNNSESMTALWAIHRMMLENFATIDPAAYNKENFDQYGMYFEMMRVIPGGNELVMEVVHRLPRTTGPCGGIPSRLHAKTLHAMMRNLEETRPGFDVFHEFSGLHGVFPVDSAVYFNDKLVALVEIDGEFHYKQLGQLLRRKDKMKEFLYKYHYPTLPLFRIRSDQCTVIGVTRAGRELANWISALVPAEELDKGAVAK